MTANRTFTVTHPNGTQDKRTSKTRTYTHAVVAVTDDAEEYAAAFDVIAAQVHEQRYAEKAAEVRAVGNGARRVIRWSSSESAAVTASRSRDLAPCSGQHLEVVAVDA